VTPKLFGSVIGFVVVAIAVGGVYTVVQPNTAQGGPSAASSITVLGTGTVTTTPDRARFSFGVQNQRKTAAGASSATAARIQRVTKALLAAGVDASDLRTEGIWISPYYDSGGFAGFSASNSVSANIRDVEGSGKVLDAATNAGATYVYGPTLFRSDRQSIARAALRAAVADARAKAEGIAAASGSTVGRVLSVVEGGAIAPSGSVTGTTGTTTTGTTGGTTPQPVFAGQQEIEANVSVTFATS
jgi:uncharacterized protein YggE